MDEVEVDSQGQQEVEPPGFPLEDRSLARVLYKRGRREEWPLKKYSKTTLKIRWVLKRRGWI